MDLLDLARRLDDEIGEDRDRDRAEVMIMSPRGTRYEILSLNWDEDRKVWVLIGE